MLDIGNKEDNFAKWNDIKEKALVIEVEDLLMLATTQKKVISTSYKLK